MIANVVAFVRSKWILALPVFAILILQHQVVRASMDAPIRDLQVDQPATVKLHIAIDATGDNNPLMTSVLTAVVPTSWPEVQGMRAHGVEEDGYFSNYMDLVSRFSDDGWNLDRFSNLSEYVLNTPSLTIQDEKATLVFNRSSYIYSVGPDNFQHEFGGVSIGSAIDTQSSAPLFAPQDLVLHIEHTNRSGSQPVSTTHQIELEIQGLQIISATPIPKHDDGAKMVWVFEAGDPASDVTVRLRPRLGTSLFLWTNLGFQFGPIRFIYGLIRSISLAPIFIAILLIVSRSRRIRLDPEAQEAAGELQDAALWALLLSTGMELLFDVFRVPRFFDRFSLFGSFGPLGDDPLDLTSFCVYILLVPFWFASQISPTKKKLLGLGILTVLFLARTAVEWFLFTHLLYTGLDFDRLEVVLILAGTWSLVILLRLGIITYLALSGIISFILKLWPAEWPQWLGEWNKDRAKIIPRLSGSLILLSFLIVCFWLAFQIQNLGGLILFNISLNNSEILFDVLGDAFQTVQDVSRSFAVNMLSSAGTLLPFIALSGLLGLLYQLSKTAKNIYLSENVEWALGLAALLFAGFVVGTGGALLGFGVPIGFLVALLIFRLTLSNRIRRAEQRLGEINPGIASLLGYRRELLQRARALENLGQRNAALYGEYTGGKLDEKSYEEKNAELQKEIERLSYGDEAVVSPGGLSWTSPAVETKKSGLDWLLELIFGRSRPASKLKPQPPASLRLTKEISPNGIALSFGPGENWWENASHALDIGWKIALFPVVFYLYVLFSKNALVWLSPQTDFGVFYLLSGLLREIVFWLAAAFVLGCLYPYLPGTNGVLKGAFLAGIWIVSVLARELIGSGEDTGWIFRSLQLLLFLTLLGAGLDLQTLLRNGIYWRSILDYYQLRDVRTVIGYVSPLILALIAIAQQLLSGQALEAITEIIKSLPQTIPLF
jgi:hypothetical protein